MSTGPWSKWSQDELRAFTYPGMGPSVVALGTFDGVHLGHQRILNEAAAMGERLGCPAVALTFDRHPMATLAPERRPRMLTPFPVRIAQIGKSGVQHVVVVEFDPSFTRMTAEGFIEDILHRALGAKGVVVGYNFRFGHGAKGDGALLQSGATTYGYAVSVVPPVVVDGVPVSSTRIRRALESGDVEEARLLLGRPYAVYGNVVHGDARGRALGYPTANLKPDDDALWPGDGVYLSKVCLDGGGEYAALTVISDRPSFERHERSIESLLLDFEGDLYGVHIKVALHRRLRDIVRFSSVEELTAQIARDVQASREYFRAEFR